MSLALLLYRPTPVQFQSDRLTAGILELDASLNENHNASASVTGHPIELGAEISDHIFLNPRRYTVEGIVSDSPVSFLAIGAVSIGAITDLTGGVSPSINAFQELNNLLESREPFDIVSGLHFYEDMVITDLTFPKSFDIGRAIRFTAQLQQLTFVESTEIAVAGATAVSPGVPDTAAPTAEMGATPTTPPAAPTPTPSEDASYLSRMTEYFGSP